MSNESSNKSGSQMDGNDSVCSDSGAQQAGKPRWFLRPLYLKVLSLVTLVLAVVCWTMVRNRTDFVNDTEIVHGEIEQRIGALLVTNIDSFDWPYANIWLNGTSNYVYRYGHPIRSGETLTIPVAKFVQKNGMRFDPRKYEIEEVWLQVPGYDLPCYEF